MMDDHAILCHARNELADALKVLLNPEIMDGADFRKAKAHAVAATGALDALLGTSDGRQIDPLEGTDWWRPFLRAYFWAVRW